MTTHFLCKQAVLLFSFTFIKYCVGCRFNDRQLQITISSMNLLRGTHICFRQIILLVLLDSPFCQMGRLTSCDRLTIGMPMDHYFSL